MTSLADVVLNVQKSAKPDKQPAKDVPAVAPTNVTGSNPAVRADDASGSPNLNTNHRHKATGSSHPKRRSMQSSYKQTSMSYSHTTPSERTGPPRSISFSSLPNSRVVSRTNSRTDGVYPPQTDISPVAGPSTQLSLDVNLQSLPEPESSRPQFRDALEYADPDQREKEREYFDRVERRKLRDSRLEEWNPIRWLSDSPRETPREEHAPFEFGAASETEKEKHRDKRPKLTLPLSFSVRSDDSPSQRQLDSGRSSSLPYPPRRQDSKSKEKGTSAPRWGRLRSLLPTVTGRSHSQTSHPGGSSALAQNSVNITDELITGGLSALMLKLWFERDEKGHRRVPILLHRLRIRISDSLHPLDGNKSVFRIECEYANGAVRWVIYRQLREFLSLHTHYAFSNAYNRNIGALPEFPKTSLPYLKFLKKEGREKGRKVRHAEFARMQRELLENYLVGLIRAVMFHSTINRLAGFLEISALSITLAHSGGVQYKAGFLHLEISKGVGLGSKSASRKTRHSQKWCAVRESYLVISEELGELTVFDVFLLDSDFKMERPKRYYRQGLHLLRDSVEDDEKKAAKSKGKERERVTSQEQKENDAENGHLALPNETDCMSTFGSIRSKMSKVFKRKKVQEAEAPSQPSGSGSGQPPRISSDGASYAESTASLPSERAPTPMLDPSTNTNPLLDPEENQDHPDPSKKRKSRDEMSKHTFYIQNSQMKLKINAKNERQMLQWIAAFEKAAATCPFTRRSRFDSFAPIRLNVAAQWLVDGRDYFWNLSRAILLAKESIYIHDWWLSPELQLRRPGKERYRLDRLLQRKAQEGVKIYIILYNEVSSRTTPTDSGYTKQYLMNLHEENIMVQRSPSHFQTGTFYWAHHEKLCVIDQAIAFMGGLDLCFGRWDTPQHVLVDDPDTLDFEANDQVWPGKDYSNGRVGDFHTLNKPEEDMYDRGKVPRMPWHDVGMQVVGQPARDLARHFIERWNYLLRIKNHSRQMPCLLPPPEFKPGELTSMGLTGTCEMQIVRSTGPWSLGTPDRIEQSIQNAYLKAIQLSEHFVYIENQFFITSTVVADVKVENRIGDAIVHRAIRAHREGTPWKCCILIPVLPGFPFPIDHSDASSIRIILEAQNRTICRGPNSIFGRLRKEGIDPTNYVSVFSLRNWAKLRGSVLTTEQVYIHGKICIVDDRLAIIGSANINERSQRGDRDSELAAVIRDTDMIDGTMAGKPFKVGRFAHTLRVRLMREHLGVDVDGMYEEDLMAAEPQKPHYDQQVWDPDQEETDKSGVTHVKPKKSTSGVGSAAVAALGALGEIIHTDTGGAIRKVMGQSNNLVYIESGAGDKSLGEERTMESRDHEKVHGFPSSIVPTMEEKVVMNTLNSIPEDGGSSRESNAGEAETDKPQRPLNWDAPETRENATSVEPTNQDVTNGDAQVLEVKQDRGDVKTSGSAKSFCDSTAPSTAVEARVDGGELYGAPADASRNLKTDDQPPHAVSGKNDATDTEWKAVHARAEIRKHLSTKFNPKIWTLPTPTPDVDPHGFEDPISDEFWEQVWVACAVHNTEIYRKVFHAVPDDLVTTWKQYKDFILYHERLNKPTKDGNFEAVARVPSEAGDEQAPEPFKSMENIEQTLGGEKPGGDNGYCKENPDHRPSTTDTPGDKEKDKEKKKPVKLDQEPFETWEREEMENLLGELRGHLVIYPTRFLEGEDIANNFLFNADRLMPLQIYN
ncbi:phospholipase D [Thelephora terrestris]|uniref:Phospholipase n=1 Tax=Thelephora terrestris TaxID=56493 RepID=A0A9P6H4Y4_9AGAM|nr:phospholipase D [Thelephora terrestris]